METTEYLVGKAARAGATAGPGSMWGRLVHCGDSRVTDPLSLLVACACSPNLQNPLQESPGLVLGDRGAEVWEAAS